ncbi:hypothetical protein [Pseudomonas phage COT4]|uniref:Uncharacterized protein n=1 Tax=Pseudomonas phage M5.1 TaxID=2873460 RepID=A0AAE9BPF7_9CAUD|nr:hypothetical protein QGX13_gp089 [Pseudomonas phage M5.1]UAV89734.1 hypothetical protein M51_153 [Pseudomonas phage M5.1]UGL61334.1 hypothetical protein [Pseudomonas phage COT4]
MSQYAVDRIALILDQIQHLHAQARQLSDEYSIPFDITLDGGRNYDTTHEYEPGYNWNSSNC